MWIRKYWFILLIVMLVGTCAANAGYQAHLRRQDKILKDQSHRRLVSTLQSKYNVVVFDSVIEDYEYAPTSFKQSAFTFPQDVIIETMFKDAIIKSGQCYVYLGNYISNNGFILTYDSCSLIRNFERDFEEVVVVADLTSYSMTDTSFYYLGQILEIVPTPLN